jgi:hypothetical protein
MNEEIGQLAGSIWRTLDASGEMTMTQLKKEIAAGTTLFDWAIGWLAREDKIELTLAKRTFRVCLKGWHPQRANAA